MKSTKALVKDNSEGRRQTRHPVERKIANTRINENKNALVKVKTRKLNNKERKLAGFIKHAQIDTSATIHHGKTLKRISKKSQKTVD